jgi:DNA-binding response OmpR family regulator
MKVLLAEDDPISLCMVQSVLAEWGYQPITTTNGVEAWQVLQGADAPSLAILDWGMPGLDGLELCRRVRARKATEPTYLILLTGRHAKADIVAGLESGANDYITKPFDRDELRARLRVGRLVVELQQSLAARVRELEASIAQVKRLEWLLPICCYCRKVRDDRNYWQAVESYFLEHSTVRFSHGICPDCLEQNMKAFQESSCAPV